MYQRKSNRSRRHTRAGFTLLEVLLVLLIIGVIMAMVVPQLLGTQDEAYVDATRASIKSLEATLSLYAQKHDTRYPEGGQEALNMLTQSEERNGRTYEPLLSVLPKDAWNNMFFYEYPNSRASGVRKPAIWSAGPNGQNENGGGDDVNNWTEYQ